MCWSSCKRQGRAGNPLNVHSIGRATGFSWRADLLALVQRFGCVKEVPGCGWRFSRERAETLLLSQEEVDSCSDFQGSSWSEVAPSTPGSRGDQSQPRGGLDKICYQYTQKIAESKQRHARSCTLLASPVSTSHWRT